MRPEEKRDAARSPAAPRIRLNDLLPKNNVTGGKGPAKVTFGASAMRSGRRDHRPGR